MSVQNFLEPAQTLNFKIQNLQNTHFFDIFGTIGQRFFKSFMLYSNFSAELYAINLTSELAKKSLLEGLLLLRD